MPRIVVRISAATNRQIDRHAEAYGLKKRRIVEEALLHHLHALRELPADLPTRITQNTKSTT